MPEAASAIQPRRCRIWEFNAESVNALAERLREGRLVVFPTETVFGIGADAASEEAVAKIFHVKKRPSWNPLICHVPDARGGRELFRFGSKAEADLADLLMQGFWPGPLSVVGPASEKVAKGVTGGSGLVAVRCPNHPVALKLLQACGIPIAAPSANKFTRISPTRLDHVLENFASDPIDILDANEPCEVGIESTVVKIQPSGREVTILRSGGVSFDELRNFLPTDIALSQINNRASHLGELSSQESDTTSSRGRSCLVQQPIGSPGCSSVHYAPRAPTFLLYGLPNTDVMSQSGPRRREEECVLDIAKCIVISPSEEQGGVLSTSLAAGRMLRFSDPSDFFRCLYEAEATSASCCNEASSTSSSSSSSVRVYLPLAVSAATPRWPILFDIEAVERRRGSGIWDAVVDRMERAAGYARATAFFPSVVEMQRRNFLLPAPPPP